MVRGCHGSCDSSGCLAPPGLKLLKLRERIGRYLGSGVTISEKCREFHEIVSDSQNTCTRSFRRAASMVYCPIQSINHHYRHREQPQHFHHTITNSISILEPKIQNLMQTHLVDASSAYKMVQGTAVIITWVKHQNSHGAIILE